MNYSTVGTDELLAQIREITMELKNRIEEDEPKAVKAKSTIDELSSVMKIDGQKRRYFMIVSTNDSCFDVEWYNQDTEVMNFYERHDGGSGIPEEELLSRNPTLWLCNLKMGKYDVIEL